MELFQTIHGQVQLVNPRFIRARLIVRGGGIAALPPEMRAHKDQLFAVGLIAEHGDAPGFGAAVVEFACPTGEFRGIKEKIGIQQLKTILPVENRGVPPPQQRIALILRSQPQQNFVNHGGRHFLKTDDVRLRFGIDANHALCADGGGAILALCCPGGKVFIVFPDVVAHDAKATHKKFLLRHYFSIIIARKMREVNKNPRFRKETGRGEPIIRPDA